MTATGFAVKKIRKFRLSARPAAVLRNLRALLENAQTTPELEKAVESEIQAAQRATDTAALYATVPPEAVPPALAEAVRPREGEDAPMAVTLFAATAGPSVEEDIAQALSRGEGLRGRLLTALGEELADQAGQFVSRLLGEEAKDEACVLSDRRAFSATDAQHTLLAALDAARLPIAFDAGGHLTPRFSRLGYVLWWPPSKKRK